ncbi:MAG: hypothetical protein ACFFCD_18200 [Promethearchaeota archaeon]
MAISNIEDFFKENDPLIADIVSYHLRLEGLLEKILKENLREPNVLDFERMMFAQKASLACAIGKLDRPLYEVIKSLNSLRNKFVHQMDFMPTFEEIHELIVSAGRAGVDFSDGIDSNDTKYVRSLNYNEGMLLNSLFRNVFYDVAWRQGEDFWKDILA